MFFNWRKKHFVRVIAPKFRRQKSRFNWRSGFFILAPILLLAGFLYLIIWSPIFKIKKLSIESSNFTPQAQAQETLNQFLQRKIWEVVPGDSLFSFFTQEATHQILSSFPEAEAVMIKKSIAAGPEIKVFIRGRQPAAIWCQALPAEAASEPATTTITIVLPQSDKCFFIDNNGLIFREAPTISGTALPTFLGQSNEESVLKSQAVSSSTIEFSLQLKKQLREIGIDSIAFRAGTMGSQELEVFVDGGWLIYFNMERPLLAQVKVLGVLLDNELKNRIAGLKYIDLRMAGKVYYR